MPVSRVPPARRDPHVGRVEWRRTCRKGGRNVGLTDRAPSARPATTGSSSDADCGEIAASIVAIVRDRPHDVARSGQDAHMDDIDPAWAAIRDALPTAEELAVAVAEELGEPLDA